MRTRKLLGIFAAAVTLVAISEATFAVDSANASPGSTGPTRVGLGSYLRTCDGAKVSVAPVTPRVMLGRGVVNLSSSGSTVVAEVQLVDPPSPGTHFDVGVIQTPRPTAATCGPGDPGTTFGGLDTDAGGQGTTTISAPIQSGTTGVWVMIARANPNSQAPAEVYTTEYVAPV